MQELIVFTNGCFDLLHAGHIHSIQTIKKCFPNSKLIIGINDDDSVRALKGTTRPIVDADTRRNMLLAIKGVDEVIIFSEATPHELINKIKPDVIVKGEDYYKETVIGFNVCTTGVFLLKHLQGFSTTSLIQKIKELD